MTIQSYEPEKMVLDFSSHTIEISGDVARYIKQLQAEVDRLERENKELKDFVKNIHDNYDCDTDQHKYQDGNGCRCCDAKKLLTYGIEGKR